MSKKHYKPGTKKVLSPRQGRVSLRWCNLVFKNTGVASNKKTRAYLADLWAKGFSHKDAGAMLVEYIAEQW